MRDEAVERAIDLARAAVNCPPDTPAVAVAVRRLDRDQSYFMVRLGSAGQSGWLAAVDPDAADVMSWARNESGESTLPEPLTRDSDFADAQYVWAPSTATRSPLYPLLLSTDPSGRRELVDLAGHRHPYPPEGPRARRGG